ncbi:Nephrocystin-3 [Bienertia sinuspersici]
MSPVTLQMIDYALGLAHSKKTDESYAEALLVLEQGLSCQSQEGTDATIENTKGIILLAISSLLSERFGGQTYDTAIFFNSGAQMGVKANSFAHFVWVRGNTDEAMRALLMIQDLTSSSVGVRVAAMEALVGLNLELGLDDTSSVLSDKCLKLLEHESMENGDEFGYKVFSARSKAIKGLVELVQGNMESAKVFFEGCEDESFIGNASLSYGEFLHAKREFNAAKEFYQKAITDSCEKKDFSDPYDLGACNMSPQEVLLAATCSLGQLESHLGNFGDAEEIMTRALKKAEEHFGTHHPKVGAVLTCIALMYRQKATAERSSSLLIQEGLYRKAIDMLKAPAIKTDDVKADVDHVREDVDKRDIVALARGGYSEVLCVQQNRNAEGEKMKNWSEAWWRNRRLSLAEALDISESSSKVLVVDTRICRAL